MGVQQDAGDDEHRLLGAELLAAVPALITVEEEHGPIFD